MKADKTFKNADDFRFYLSKLHKERRKRKHEERRKREQEMRHNNRKGRRTLSPSTRSEVLRKTASRCHICGDNIEANEQWDADHVFAHAHGGAHAADNFLPAHSLCNSYRWFYSAEEFQWILKLGVWFRTKIERKNNLALELAQRFVQYENIRHSRRKR